MPNFRKGLAMILGLSGLELAGMMIGGIVLLAAVIFLITLIVRGVLRK